MKHAKKLYVLLLAGVLLLSSCTPSAPPADTTEPSGTETDAQAEPEGTVRFTAPEDSSLVFSSSDAEAGAKVKPLYGSIRFENGEFRTTKRGDYSTLLFDTGELGDFIAEFDFVDHRAGGGLIVRADKDKVSGASANSFYGYLAFIGKDGGLGAFGAASDDGGWKGNFFVSEKDVTKVGTSLHLRVLAVADYLVYTVRDNATGEEVFRYEYRLGDSKNDVLSATSGLVGLRLYNDGGVGCVKNVEIRSLKPVAEALTLKKGESFTATLTPGSSERLTVLSESGAGYAFQIDAGSDTVLVTRLTGWSVKYAARYSLPITEGKEYPVGVTLADGACRFFFSYGDYPLFEGAMTDKTATVNASFSFSSALSAAPAAPEKTYKNPVVSGADPEIFFEDGVYYLYTFGGGSGNVSVQTSTDLCSWSEKTVCLTPKNDIPTLTSFMSPNVFKSGDTYYLLIASTTEAQPKSRIRYATASSPAGPFKMKGENGFVNDAQEIGGAPFIDEDGKIYLTTVRFGGGNHIYIQEIKAENGTITPVTSAKLVIDPDQYYEIDDYGKIAEGGVITKHNGLYYMLYASGHYKGHYGEACAVSENIYGPYQKIKHNEVLSFTSVADGVGDCVFVSSPDGSEIFVAYHRHTSVGNEGSSRSICLDRVIFVPDPDGGPDLLRIVGPTSTPQKAPSAS
ncbi:MAG: family 43 glycosylhydrolase [Clostridia bacterium]|nr:family 43 glycosylhydrolase [Clostridia bacterium]